MSFSRRDFLKHSSALPVAASLPAVALPALAAAPAAARTFEPRVQGWRTFELTTRVDLQQAQGVTQAWVPLPSVNSDYQRSLDSGFSSSGQARIADDGTYGARMLHVQFDAADAQPFVEVTSRVQTRDRAVDWAAAAPAREDASTLRFWTRPTALIPTEGIVHSTALQATRGARDDVAKVRALYDWIVENTYRNPQVRGCGEGDIRAMLQGGDRGGKCADINALFVGMARSVGVPARDLYGVRVAPSAFGYRELGGNPAKLAGAQHCRAEVYLQAHGWVAMDPADVTKVMRQETDQWIKASDHALVAPVKKGLFGCCEGNWIAYNTAHDVRLPGARGAQLGFFMYPMAEGANGRLDAYAPDDFKYRISARELA